MIRCFEKHRAGLTLAVAILLASGIASAQESRTSVEALAIGMVGGAVASDGHELSFLAGSAPALIGAQSERYALSLGFIPVMDELTAAGVWARAVCPAVLPAGCPLSVPVVIDVSRTRPSELLGSFTGALQWDPAALTYTGNSGLQSGFAGAINADDAASGRLAFSGANATGDSGAVVVLTVDFEVAGSAGDSSGIALTFSAMASARTIVDLLPLVRARACSFVIGEADRLGDVNGDGLVNSTDALIILSYDAGLGGGPFQVRIDRGVGDANSDGPTNSTDALIILSHDVGFEVPFPLGEKVCP